MTSSPGYKRNYKQEYKSNQSSEEQKKNRAARNTARRQHEKKNGDLPSNVDVAHKVALSKGGSTSLANTKAEKASGNRSFSRTKSGALKSETSKREKKKK